MTNTAFHKLIQASSTETSDEELTRVSRGVHETLNAADAAFISHLIDDIDDQGNPLHQMHATSLFIPEAFSRLSPRIQDMLSIKAVNIMTKIQHIYKLSNARYAETTSMKYLIVEVREMLDAIKRDYGDILSIR